MILLSIIIPVYNTETYLEFCIDSIINQNINNYEIIVVNDASNGNCDEIVEKYIKKYNHIKLIKHKYNRGLYQARLTGILNSNGKYIMHVDSDDYLCNNIIKYILNKIPLDYDLLFFDCIITDGKKILDFDNWYSIPLYEMNNNSYIMDYFFDGYNHTMWGKVYKKEVLDKCISDFPNIENITQYEDLMQNLIISRFINNTYSIHKIGYCYRMNENGSSKKQLVEEEEKEKFLRNTDNIIKIIVEFVLKYSLDLYYIHTLCLLKNIINNSYRILKIHNIDLYDYINLNIPIQFKDALIINLIKKENIFKIKKKVKKNKLFSLVIGTRIIQIILFGIVITIKR